MRYYLAGPFMARDALLRIRDHWAKASAGRLQCTSTWLLSTRPIRESSIGASPESGDVSVQMHASDDLRDVYRAHAFVMVTGAAAVELLGDPSLDPKDYRLHTGGRQVELGYALSRGKRVLLIGEPENVFQRGLANHPTASVDEAFGVLMKYALKDESKWESLRRSSMAGERQ